MQYFRASFRMTILGIIIGSLLVSSLVISLLFQGIQILKRKPLAKEALLSKNLSWHFNLLILLTGIEFKVHEDLMKPMSSAGNMILCNHISYLDIILLAAIYPLAFVAKEEVGAWPILGAVTKVLNTIYVSRENTMSRVRCLHQIRKNIGKVNYCIFPEGTTTSGTIPKIENWNAGNLFVAKQLNLRLHIVGINYFDHNEIFWIDDMTLLPHLWTLMKKKKIRAQIQVRELTSQVFKSNNIRQVAELVCSEVQSLCSKPMTTNVNFLANQNNEFQTRIRYQESTNA